MNNDGRNNKNPWNHNNKRPSKISTPGIKRFEQTLDKPQAELQATDRGKHKEYLSSSDEEELEAGDFIGAIIKNYDEKNLLGRTEGFLQDAFLSSAATCLICISSIKRNDSVWSCAECYCLFHLMCIQRWSKDSITQKKLALEGPIQVRQIKIKWSCPKCRYDYEPKDIPLEYLCFCKKTKEPIFQPMIAPHSCGEKCGKDLKPHCGHQCVLLCHPGPCPPCPTTIKIACYCGAKPAKLQRCSNKEWSCGSPCNKILMCGKHKCSQPCHSGDCLPCPKKSIQKCICTTSQKLRECASPLWQCDKVCHKPLSCRNHSCPEICHIGKCDSCILSKPRTCPCGKTTYQLLCTQETPTCGDTCGKLLECGMHICNQRCHKDKCGTCVETVEKSCRCGLHVRAVQCKKLYLCETKCKNVKDCNKHPCNRKCCDGNCPPCEKPCGRTLKCGNHKCGSVCHRGPCYPCNLKEKLFCYCNETFVTAPCGRKQRTRPPKCNLLCKIPPNCHHEKRENHRCHFGDCPPCKIICNKDRSSCKHKCPSPCHSVVLIKVEGQKASMPWEQTGPQIKKKCLPCPNCIVPISVTCLGDHETCDWPCHMATPSSCQRSCGRILPCENHTCNKACHLVEGALDDDKAGSNCEACDSACTKERPIGCNHNCPKPCHPGSCPACKQMIRIKCHCGLNQPYIACKDWTQVEKKEDLQSCGNQCPNNFECGHRCRANCHSGPCPNSEQCKKKVKVPCACKRIKKEFSCETVRNSKAEVNCDALCAQKKDEEQREKELQNEKRKVQEELKNKKELEKYEKIFQNKKKNRERRAYEESPDKHFLEKYWLVFTTLAVALGFGIYVSYS